MGGVGRYEVYLSNDQGTRLLLLDQFVGLRYSIVQHAVGVCELTLPPNFDAQYIREDYRIEVNRAYPGGPMRLENTYLIRRWEFWMDERGQEFIKIVGVDGNDLLRRYVVMPYRSNQEYGVKRSGTADNVAKRLVRENVAQATALEDIADRGISSVYFAVAANTTAGASINSWFTWANVLDAVNDCMEQSIAAGTYVFWRVLPVSAAQFRFETYANQIGTDRSELVVVALQNNNMRAPRYTWDSTEAVSMARGLGETGGYSDPNDRRISTAVDTARQKVSVFGHVETTVEVASDESSETLAAAKAEVRENRPKETFTAELTDNDTQIYGRDWNFGDKVRVVYRNVDEPARVVAVVVEMGNAEKIRARLEIPRTSNITSA